VGKGSTYSTFTQIIFSPKNSALEPPFATSIFGSKLDNCKGLQYAGMIRGQKPKKIRHNNGEERSRYT
jgi:hypothetical protein